MSEVKYIIETNEFIVDGKVVKASSLTESEKKSLMAKATNNNLLVGSNNEKGSLLI